MNDFEFPTNIRQIGSIGDGLRIYIEDYAYTYLKHYAESGGYDERIALLVGQHMVIDGNKVLFISGAIQGMHAEQGYGILTFSDQSMSYAYEKMQLYFRGLEIVGWMQSQPSYGVALNSNSVVYHASAFLKPDQVLFLMDPIEDLNTFYTWSTEKQDLIEVCGYFIYYDKNRGMQEYMFEARAQERPVQSSFRLLSKPTEQDEPGKIPAPTAVAPAWGKAEPIYEGQEPHAVPVSFIKPKISETPSPVQERRLTNLLVSMSAVLVLICFMMGAALIQNEGRITFLEEQLVRLSGSLRDMIASVDNGAESAFAPSQTTETPMTAIQDMSQAENLMLQENPEPVLVSPTPSPEPTHAAEPATMTEMQDVPETYTVEQGDSLLHISRKFYGTADMVSTIMELNGIDDPDILRSGATIRLPRPE